MISLRIIFIKLFLVFSLYGCAHQSNEVETPVKNVVRSPATGGEKSSQYFNCQIPLFHFKKVIESQFKKIDSTEYIRIKNLLEINILPIYSRYEKFFISNPTFCGNSDITQFIYKDESCCTSVYYLTHLKGRQKYTDCKLVALSGSDANWSEKDSIVSFKQNTFQVTKLISSGIENEKTGKVWKYENDSIIINYSFQIDGHIIQSRLDSVRNIKFLKE